MLFRSLKDLNTGVGVDILKRLFSSSRSFYPSMIEHITGVIPNQWHSNYSDMAKTKFISMLKYVRIYPEFRFIFIGDSGQGDLICANDIYEHKKEFPTFPIRGCFIHNIMQKNGSKPFRMIQDDKLIEELKKRDIFLFNNYIDLANQLYSLELISSSNLQNMVSETLTDFKENKKANVYINDPEFVHFLEEDLELSASKFKTDKTI